MCDPKKSGIDDDPRKDFYSKIDKFSNLYAVEIGMGDAYSHKFDLISPQDLVRWTGVVVRDGVKGGSDGAVYRRWMDGASYDEKIDESMNHLVGYKSRGASSSMTTDHPLSRVKKVTTQPINSICFMMFAFRI
jgi:hypothetical protein